MYKLLMRPIEAPDKITSLSEMVVSYESSKDGTVGNIMLSVTAPGFSDAMLFMIATNDSHQPIKERNIFSSACVYPVT